MAMAATAADPVAEDLGEPAVPEAKAEVLEVCTPLTASPGLTSQGQRDSPCPSGFVAR